MAVPSMHVLAAKQPVAGGYDPLSIAWHSAYWAEDPNWTNPGDGNAVTTWDDASGNGRSVTQGTSGKRPLYRASVAALNSQPAVDFDGTDDYLASGSAFTATSGTLTKVVVIQVKTVVVGTRHIFSWGSTGGRADLYYSNNGSDWGLYAPSAQVLGGTPDTSAHILFATFGTSVAALNVDGVDVATGTNSGSLSTHTLGAYSGGGENIHANIAFAGLYVGNMSAGDRADLLAWAQDHYGTP